MFEKGTALNEMIDKSAPKIIGLVDEFAKKHYNAITSNRNGNRQFVDLIEASAEACCIDEFKLYIKYKGAKEGTHGLWGGLATHLNTKIDELIRTVADEIEVNNETVKLEVLRRFCGYLMWRAHADISERRRSTSNGI